MGYAKWVQNEDSQAVIHRGNWLTDACAVSQRRDEIGRRRAAAITAQWPVGWENEYTQVEAIKSDTDAWSLIVLAVLSGGLLNGRDADGQYFSAATKLYLDHALRTSLLSTTTALTPTRASLPVSRSTSARRPATKSRRMASGPCARLDMANDYARGCGPHRHKGKAPAAVWRTCTASHRTGHITHWPVRELSISMQGQPATTSTRRLPQIISGGI